MPAETITVRTPTLDIVCEVHGDRAGKAVGDPVILLHGFPYDVRAYDEVAPPLAAAGRFVVVPYLRGYGPTRFRSAETPRSGQQGVLARDLLDLMDGLEIGRAVLGGYDWGGRAACIVSALWPERVAGLVTADAYNVHDVPNAHKPAPAEAEPRLWYQFYFHLERGRAGLEANRRDICRLLWRTWSPSWAFDDATFAATAPSFDNPDFVDVVIHSYRVRYANAPADPAVADIETALEAQPEIAVPTISLHGLDDGVTTHTAAHAKHDRFTGRFEHRDLPGVGHNIPQEVPNVFADALLAVG